MSHRPWSKAFVIMNSFCFAVAFTYWTLACGPPQKQDVPAFPRPASSGLYDNWSCSSVLLKCMPSRLQTWGDHFEDLFTWEQEPSNLCGEFWTVRYLGHTDWCLFNLLSDRIHSILYILFYFIISLLFGCLYSFLYAQLKTNTSIDF